MHNENIIKEFRENGGTVGGPFAGMKLLLITIKGAKTGTLRTNPLAYSKDGDNYVIIASKGGADTNPDWYHNLTANPNATIEVGSESIDVLASEAKGAERDRLYDAQAELYPGFKDYELKTARKIPVFVLKQA
jgi:deazaflavin-dependent oxidoreductase (nitroreductase family)